MNHKHITGLDALRGISATMVVLAHLGILPSVCGTSAVGIFFVLSGFLITHLLLKEAGKIGDVSLRAFYLRRTLRIFPAFYVFWLLCVLAHFSHVPHAEVVASFFYLGDYYNATRALGAAGIMGITWSLGVEEKFYFLWPFAFRKCFDDTRRMVSILLTVIVAAIIYRWLPISRGPDYLLYAFESRIDNIAFGCLLAVAVDRGILNNFITKVTAKAWYPLISICAFCASLWADIHLGREAYTYRYGLTIEASIISILLIQFVHLSKSGVWKFLEWKPLRFTGNLSYSLYLYHMLVIYGVERLLPNLRLRWQLPLCLLLSYLAATLSYFVIEKPFLRLKDRLSVDHRATGNSPATADCRDGLTCPQG